MLDKDLAELYGVDPRRLREQVKRNFERFPANFMFQLAENEVDGVVSQIATPQAGRRHFGGHLPYAFTEHGVLMLASVLRSKTAMEVSVRIIELFVKMREMLSTHKDILLKLEQLERKVDSHDDHIGVISTRVDHSDRRLSTGLAEAALNVRIESTTSAIPSSRMPPEAKTHQLRSV
jgi:hypothetical protein